MGAIGPGDWVEAVKAWHDPEYPQDDIEIGALYFVVGTCDADSCHLCGDTSFGILLRGKCDEADDNGCYCTCMFRPIRDGQERIVRSVKICELV